MSKTSCVLPWIHVASRTNGTLRPCCFSKFTLLNPNSNNVYKNSFKEILSSQALSSIRKQMILGEKPDECQVCYSVEDRGVISKRQLENNKWGIDQPSLIPKYLDLRFNSSCNLKCIMCSVSESTSWKNDSALYFSMSQNHQLKAHFSDMIQVGALDTPVTNIFWNNFKSHILEIEEIYFAGGEPLIQKEHDKCLEIIKANNRHQNIRLVYNTNGTYITPEVIDSWQFFKNVQVNLSLDGFGEKNSYIRYPSDWESVLKTLTLLDNTKDNIQVRITTTVQALNVFYIKEFIEWKIVSGYKKIQNQRALGDIDINILYSPAHMNVQLLSPRDKIRAKNSLKEIMQLKDISSEFKAKISGLILYMFEEDTSYEVGFNAFVEYLKILDTTRCLDSQNIFPILKELSID